MQKPKICVLGSANVDSFVYVKHIPVPGETLQAESYMTANGGKGANQAVAAGKLSGGCTFAGQVGDDDDMRNLQKEMSANNVELQWKVRKDVTTGKAFIYVDENTGQNSIVIVGGANTAYTGIEALPEEYVKAIEEGQYLLLQKQIPIGVNLMGAKLAKQKGKTVVLDCGGSDEPIPQQLLHLLDVISPNETELLRIDPNIDFTNPVQEIRKKLISKFPQLKVLLKLGSKGSAMITADQYVPVDVVTAMNESIINEHKIIDTVGAGDCFTAGFVVKHSELDWSQKQNESENYRKCMVFANSAAFICITRKGAMPSMPSREEVEKFMAQYKIQ